MYQSTDPADVLITRRFSHKRIDDLFANPISADRGANYAKHLFLNLSTLSPYISGPNTVKKATPLKQYVNPSVSSLVIRLSCNSIIHLPVEMLTQGATGWLHRTSRSIKVTWYRALILGLLTLRLPPRFLEKPHLSRSLIQ